MIFTQFAVLMIMVQSAEGQQHFTHIILTGTKLCIIPWVFYFFFFATNTAGNCPTGFSKTKQNSGFAPWQPPLVTPAPSRSTSRYESLVTNISRERDAAHFVLVLSHGMYFTLAASGCQLARLFVLFRYELLISSCSIDTELHYQHSLLLSIHMRRPSVILFGC